MRIDLQTVFVWPRIRAGRTRLLRHVPLLIKDADTDVAAIRNALRVLGLPAYPDRVLLAISGDLELEVLELLIRRLRGGVVARADHAVITAFAAAAGAEPVLTEASIGRVDRVDISRDRTVAETAVAGWRCVCCDYINYGDVCEVCDFNPRRPGRPLHICDAQS